MSVESKTTDSLESPGEKFSQIYRLIHDTRGTRLMLSLSEITYTPEKFALTAPLVIHVLARTRKHVDGAPRQPSEGGTACAPRGIRSSSAATRALSGSPGRGPREDGDGASLWTKSLSLSLSRGACTHPCSSPNKYDEFRIALAQSSNPSPYYLFFDGDFIVNDSRDPCGLGQ